MKNKRWKWLILIVPLTLIGLLIYFYYGESEKQPSDSLKNDRTSKLGSVTGLVIDGHMGTEIASATVILKCEDGTNRKQNVDSDGRFEFADQPAGNCTIESTAPDYLPGGRKHSASAEIGIRDGRTLPDIVLTLYHVCEVSGTVSLDGAPIQGAKLSVLYLESVVGTDVFSLDMETESDSQGAFHLKGLEPGRIQVMAELEGYAMAESPEEFLSSGSVVTNIEIKLSGAALISVTVVDQDEQPVADAEVSLAVVGVRRPQKGFTNDNGQFIFEQVPPGTFQLSARARGYMAVYDPIEGEIEAGDTAKEQIALERVAGISGKVEDQHGGPVSGAAIMVKQTENGRGKVLVLSDSNGEFWLQGPFTSARIWVRAMHPKYGPASEMGVDTDSDAGIVLVLTAPGRIVGQVVSEKTGEPVTSFRIQVVTYLPEDGDPMPGGGFGNHEFHDAGGWFELSPFSPGVYSFEVFARSHTPKRIAQVTVEAGEEVDVGTIGMTSAGSLTGRVIDENGAPLSGTVVTANGLNRGGVRAMSDRAGRFVLSGVPAERVSLEFSHSGFLRKIVSGLEASPGVGDDIGDVIMEKASKDQKGQFRYAGMGTVLSSRNGKIFVQDIFDDAPAFRSGLTSGSEILEVDGIGVQDLGLRRSVELIRGEEGTEVILKIIQDGSPYPEIIRVERASILSQSRSRRR